LQCNSDVGEQGLLRVQAHKPLIRAYECLWYNHISTHSRRDQLSLIQVMRDLELLPRIRALSRRVYGKRKHMHETGRRLDQVVSVRQGSRSPVPQSQGGRVARRVFFDVQSPDPLPALRYFFRLAKMHQMAAGWQTLLLSSGGVSAEEVANALRPYTDTTVTTKDAAGFDLRSVCSVQDMVVMRVFVTPTNDTASILRRYMDDGTLQLVDLLIVEYSTYDPTALSEAGAVDFRAALREVVETWGVSVMPHWNSSRNMGWDERVWSLACRRNDHLRMLLAPYPSSFTPSGFSLPTLSLPSPDALRQYGPMWLGGTLTVLFFFVLSRWAKFRAHRQYGTLKK
jgi:hypothetical protein